MIESPLPPPPLVGGRALPGPVFLAPVAGFSDRPFRAVCLGWGADLCYTEMVSAEALVRDSKKTAELLTRADGEKRYAIQLFGSKPDRMAAAAGIASRWQPDLIDINAGCPVPKVIKTGAGSALMKDPDLIRSIVKAMTEATDIPVTVKFRLGWDEGNRTFIEFAHAAVQGGAAALTLHARTRAQGYSGQADWAAIAEMKGASAAGDLGRAVPVFASGDVFTAEDALRLFQATRCDGVMVARGAIGNPFIFKAIKELAATGSAWAPSAGERARTMLDHLDGAIEAFGERPACIEFRKHFCSYTKGIHGGAELRREGIQASTRVDYQRLAEILERHEETTRQGSPENAVAGDPLQEGEPLAAGAPGVME
jgi:tRNA-dihydrouridine synthase B